MTNFHVIFSLSSKICDHLLDEKQDNLKWRFKA